MDKQRSLFDWHRDKKQIEIWEWYLIDQLSERINMELLRKSFMEEILDDG